MHTRIALIFAGTAGHLKDLKDLYANIERGSLPQLSFYKPIGQLNLHPGYANISDGDAHLGELVDILQRSPLYADMLIIITYDEHGGFWDHVPPPVRDRWGPGTLIPLIAVGPTVKRGFVDHTTYDFGAILKTIEERFGLAPLTDADGSVPAQHAEVSGDGMTRSAIAAVPGTALDGGQR